MPDTDLGWNIHDFEQEVAAEIGHGFCYSVGMDGLSDANAIIAAILANGANPGSDTAPEVVLGVRVWLEIIRADGVAVRARGTPSEYYSEPPNGFDERMAVELSKPENFRARAGVGKLYQPARKA